MSFGERASASQVLGGGVWAARTLRDLNWSMRHSPGHVLLESSRQPGTDPLHPGSSGRCPSPLAGPCWRYTLGSTACTRFDRFVFPLQLLSVSARATPNSGAPITPPRAPLVSRGPPVAPNGSSPRAASGRLTPG